MGMFSPEEYFGGISKSFEEDKPLYAWLKIFAGIGGLIIFLGAVTSALVFFFNIKISREAYQPPPLQISYETISENNQNGIFETLFKITIIRPPGNFEYNYEPSAKILGAECSNTDWRETVTYSDGSSIAVTKMEWEIKCKSYTHIIKLSADKMFDVVKSNHE